MDIDINPIFLNKSIWYLLPENEYVDLKSSYNIFERKWIIIIFSHLSRGEFRSNSRALHRRITGHGWDVANIKNGTVVIFIFAMVMERLGQPVYQLAGSWFACPWRTWRIRICRMSCRWWPVVQRRASSLRRLIIRTISWEVRRILPLH